MANEESSSHELGPPQEQERERIIEANINAILDSYYFIDPDHQPTGSSAKRGIKGRNRFDFEEGVPEYSTRLLYDTATGEIMPPPKEFFAEIPEEVPQDYPYKVGQFSAIDTWLREEGPLRVGFPNARYLLRLQMPPESIPFHAIGNVVDQHRDSQAAKHHMDARHEAFMEGDLDRAREHEETAVHTLDRRAAADARYAELYRSGPLIVPRRLVPGWDYNEGMLYEPWGKTNPTLFAEIPQPFFDPNHPIDPKGDLIMKASINEFNKRYGPEWIRELPEI